MAKKAENKTLEDIQAKALKASGEEVKEKPTEYQPIYKKVGDSKIPVSKNRGKLWKSRRDIGVKADEHYMTAADEAVKYFRNDQMNHRNSKDASAGNRTASRRINNQFSETENIVYSNTVTMLPILYAKNPSVECTPTDETSETTKKQATMIERLVNAVMSTKNAPGVNIKPKAKRAVLSAQLTNRGYILIGYTEPKASAGAAMKEINEIAAKLEKEDLKVKEIEELEGQLMALEEKLDVLEPEGGMVKNLPYNTVIVDPDSMEDDFSDARWLMYCDMLPTSYLNAVYREKGDDGKYKNVYNPSHVMNAGVKESDDADEAFSPFKSGKEDPSAYGYDNADSYDRAKRTKVWYVFDKVTRRIEMYDDANWNFPIWVWDDPYRLDRFFPIYRLGFVSDPVHSKAKGEVTYYLDQQDAINEINSEERRARQWAIGNIIYNSNLITKKDVEAVLKGQDGTARGIKLPEGLKLADVIMSMVPPSMNYLELFQKDGKYAAIDRISSTNEIVRGGQFKTNTTNRAIEQYQDSASIRLEEKTDLIEDFIGDIGWGLAQLYVQYASKEVITMLIGKSYAELWQNMTPDEFRTMYNMTVVGGSTKKPTSRAKKEEAIEVGQILGQFASATPMAIIVWLKILEQAYDEIIINDQMWKQIEQSIMQQMQPPAQAAAPQAAPAPVAGAAPPSQGGGIEQVISELQAQGIPPEVAIAEIQKLLQTNPNQPPTNGAVQ